MKLFSSLRDTSGPAAAVEIAATRVSGASLEWRGGQAALTAHAVEALPDRPPAGEGPADARRAILLV